MRVRLESVADWLAASDSGSRSSPLPPRGPALTFDLPWELRNHGVGWVRGVERLRNGGVPRNSVFLMPATANPLYYVICDL